MLCRAAQILLGTAVLGHAGTSAHVKYRHSVPVELGPDRTAHPGPPGCMRGPGHGLRPLTTSSAETCCGTAEHPEMPRSGASGQAMIDGRPDGPNTSAIAEDQRDRPVAILTTRRITILERGRIQNSCAVVLCGPG
jgi:hypothetical protein